MRAGALSYGVVTPVRNEAGNLTRLATALTTQTAAPAFWVLVDNGSTDATQDVARALAAENEWIRVVVVPGDQRPVRGGPVVRAFRAGVDALAGDLPDVVVKLDADVTFGSNYFERLLDAFATDPALGIASGLCHEYTDGVWQPVYGTRSHVWGASRAYRRECLVEVVPLEERQGWDEIDALKAQVRGWKVGTRFDIAFRHHRSEGRRDGGRRRWLDQGETAHYMGYRPSYLLARALFKTVREPAAIAMVWGYLKAALGGAPQWADSEARSYLRSRQRFREIPSRAREALGKS